LWAIKKTYPKFNDLLIVYFFFFPTWIAQCFHFLLFTIVLNKQHHRYMNIIYLTFLPEATLTSAQRNLFVQNNFVWIRFAEPIENSHSWYRHKIIIVFQFGDEREKKCNVFQKDIQLQLTIFFLIRDSLPRSTNVCLTQTIGIRIHWEGIKIT
jgi:hypothetical protein